MALQRKKLIKSKWPDHVSDFTNSFLNDMSNILKSYVNILKVYDFIIFLIYNEKVFKIRNPKVVLFIELVMDIKILPQIVCQIIFVHMNR